MGMKYEYCDADVTSCGDCGFYRSCPFGEPEREKPEKQELTLEEENYIKMQNSQYIAEVGK